MMWFCYAIASFILHAFCFITNPIIILFCDEEGELHGLLRLWQTWDDSCDSEFCLKEVVPKWLDYNFDEHYYQTVEPKPVNRRRFVTHLKDNSKFTFKQKVQRYFCRLIWLSRNCAYGWRYEKLSKTVDGNSIQIITKTDDTIYCKADNAWMFKCTKPINKYLRWEIFIGWKLELTNTNKFTAMLANRIMLRITK